jgi:hypothetical protein
VPDTVQAVVAARIDLLGPAEKAALQAASLIGRVFWSGPVYELLGGLTPDLRVLEERDFVRRRHGSAIEGEREYSIKHTVPREVAYASIPKARRARLHATFADWLERFGDGKDEYAPLLAHHFGEAVRPEDADLAWAGDEQEHERIRGLAVSWLERAGELAVRRCDIEEALFDLHRAVELESDREALARLWHAIGHANAIKFDGEAFLAAMQHALALVSDDSQAGEVYSELAFHTIIRTGMWPTRPDPQVVEEWVDRALRLSEPDGPAYTRALIARAQGGSVDDATAREASRLAERLGDPELRSYAWMACASTAFHNFRFDEASDWAERRFDLLPEIDDPDLVLEVYETALPAAAAVGRLTEARRFARQHDELAARLTSHHRMHGVALRAEVEETAGDWGAIVQLTPAIEAAVAANVDTPCVRNARTLLLCAVASEVAGDAARAAELEAAAADVGFTTHDWALVPPRMRLALVRGDVAALPALVSRQTLPQITFGIVQLAVRLDALAALRDEGRLDVEAEPLLMPGTYIEPFALRALAIVRDDPDLLARADERFAELGLEWHRAQTELLLAAAGDV